MFACSAYGLVCLPLYDTLGTEAMEHICRQAPPVAVVCETLQLATNIIKWTHGSVSHIFLINHDSSLHQFRQTHGSSTSILTFDELMVIGRNHMKPVEPSVKSQALIWTAMSICKKHFFCVVCVHMTLFF
ncbi:unnamed protein product [Dicrocoelium dendriticum]|nr:unnamed protein product [Dicrocoelium dendriticum]